MQTLFGGRVDPYTPEPIAGKDAQSQFMSWLFGNVGKGQEPYPGKINTDVKDTRLPEVWNSWQPWDAGTQFLANYNQNGWMMGKPYSDALSSTMEYGGFGYPIQLMHNMAQYGGTGGPGNYGMSYAMQFGAPSEAGRPVVNTSQTGGSGAWGQLLTQRALGGPSAALSTLNPFIQRGFAGGVNDKSYMLPFLMAKPYQPVWRG